VLPRIKAFAGWFAFGLHDYAFWLLAVSALCFLLERLFPWRPDQRTLRPLWGQDVFWLLFNGHVLGVLLWRAPIDPGAWLDRAFAGAGLSPPEAWRLVGGLPLAAQFAVLLVVKDLLDWGVHNLLHRVPFLWAIHRVHHSIEELDWIGNFRFHWGEVLVYRGVTYLPLVALGVRGEVFLWHAVVTTLIGHLNHSNLGVSWGPLRYLVNSPKMHVWHHARLSRGSPGKNFAIVFSAWDWLFRTAELPSGQPATLGFEGMERFPRALWARLSYPVSLLFWKPAAPTPGSRAG
jgi:sterol desaturase/sphingolipid hydroxylase (fatty acid hydroxylase superfamily)